MLRGGPGDDTLAPGLDTRPAADITPDVLSWHSATHGVTIDIPAGHSNGEGHDDFDATNTSVVGSTHGDTILGSQEADRIYGGSGPDDVHARGGDDWVVDDGRDPGGAAADVIRGGPGADELTVTLGRDTVYSGAGDDYLVNPASASATGHWDMATGSVLYELDHLVGMVAEQFEAGDFNTYGTTWTVHGSPLDDTVTADGTNGTTFYGLDGNDSFRGSSYDDVFDGGPGTDHSLGMGGDGNDTCISVELFDDSSCESQ